MQSLVVYDLLDDTPKILLEVPRNPQEADYTDSFLQYGPVWSPNSEYLAIVHRLNEEKSIPLIVNVNTGKVQEISTTMDVSTPIRWSPDGATIAWGRSGGLLELCEIDVGGCENINLANFDIWGQSIDWGPYGGQVVYTDSGVFDLNLLDPVTGSEQKIPIGINGLLENPRWSSNGQYIATDYRPNMSDFFQSLLIIEPISGQIASQIQVEHSESEWAWGKDNEMILMLTGTQLSGYGLAIFDMHNGTLKPIPLPDDLKTKQIRYPTW